MIARPSLWPLRAPAVLPLAAVALAGPFAADSRAADGDVALPPTETQTVDAKLVAACSQPGIQAIRATVVGVQVRGTLPTAAHAGRPFTFDGLTARFTIEPDLLRPQVEGTSGTLNARLDDFALIADGGSPTRSSVVSATAPLDLGTKPVPIARAPFFDAPVGAPKATFDPVGPWTIDAAAGGVAVGLDAFTLTLTPGSESPGFGTTFVSGKPLICKPSSPYFAKFRVDGPPPVEQAPVVTGLDPNIGPGGTTVTIRGTNLQNATGVAFEGNPAVFKLVSDTELRAIVPTLNFLVPPPPTLAWDVSVTNGAGTSVDTPADDFTYLTGTPFPPVVKIIVPSTVTWWRGATVRVAGSALKGATKVTIGGTAAKFTVRSDSELSVTAAPRLPGTYAVRVTTPGGTSAATKVASVTYR